MRISALVEHNHGDGGTARLLVPLSSYQLPAILINKKSGKEVEAYLTGASNSVRRFTSGQTVPGSRVDLNITKSGSKTLFEVLSSASPRANYDWDIDTNFYEGQTAANQPRPTLPRKPVIPTKPPKSLHLDIQQWFQEIMGAGMGKIDLLFKKLDAELKLKLGAVTFADAFYKSLMHRLLRKRDQIMIAITRPGPVALKLLRKYRVPFLHLDWDGDKKLHVLSGSVQNGRTRAFIKKYNMLVEAA